MKRIAGYLKERYSPWGWMGQRAHDACGINLIMPLDFIISCNYGTEIPYYFREEDVFSVEAITKKRKNWSNEDLKSSLKGQLGRMVFERWNSYGRKVHLLCYRSVRRLEGDCRQIRYRPGIYAVPEALKRRFDNKILLHKNLPGLSIPGIPGMAEKPGKVTFNRLRKELSLPFVVQFPYGSSGNSTFIIREEKEFNRLRRAFPDTKAVIRKYIDGFSLNANAVIISTEDGPRVLCSMPSVQITGRPECSSSPSVFCGNDYAASKDVDPAVIGRVNNNMTVIGAWMAASGFRGIFGMDFVVGGGIPFPVEINPRFQNSTSLHTVLCARSGRGEEALFLPHIAEFLRKNDRQMDRYLKEIPGDAFMRPVEGSQIIIHNKRQESVVMGDLEPGIYRLEGDHLVFTGEGATLSDCRDRGDVLLTCGIPKKYTVTDPDAPICKVQMPKNALETSGKRKFTRESRRIIADVYRKLCLREAGEAGAMAADERRAVL